MKAHPALNDEHEALLDTMRRSVAREIASHAAAWDKAEEFPRGLYGKESAACSAPARRRGGAAAIMKTLPRGNSDGDHGSR